MTHFDLINKSAQEIIVGENRLLPTEKQNSLITKMTNSIKEVGLHNPILITEDFKLIDGFIRLKAMERLNFKVPCFIVKEEEYKLKLIEIDTNVIRRNLTQLQISRLLKVKKDIYEELHPNSTKEAKVKNNLKKVEDREELPPTFSEVAAEEMNCSSKKIQNNTNNIEKIEDKNPKTLDLMSLYEEKASNAFKGVEIDKIANMDEEEMEKFNIILEEKIENQEKFKISDILTDNNKKYSKNQQLNMILEYEISLLKNDISRFNNTQIDIIEEFKKFHKVDFSNTLQKLLNKNRL